MVTKYDIFEAIYKYQHPIKPIEILKMLNKNEREYNNIIRIINGLVDDNLIVKTPYDIIYHCLSNDLNYNYLIDYNFMKFVSIALKQKEITSKDIKLNPKTLKKYINILNENNLILLISEKPLRAKIFFNTLLNNLFVYFGYKYIDPTEDSSDYVEDIVRELVLFRKLRKGKEQKYKQIVEELEIY